MFLQAMTGRRHRLADIKKPASAIEVPVDGWMFDRGHLRDPLWEWRLRRIPDDAYTAGTWREKTGTCPALVFKGFAHTHSVRPPPSPRIPRLATMPVSTVAPWISVRAISCSR